METRKPSDAALQRGVEYALLDRLAPYYERHLVDECHYRTPEVVALAVRDFVAPAAEGTAGRPFLDLGAGTGLVGKELAKLSLAIDLVALDLSEAMLEQIDSPLYSARIVADCLAPLPFPDRHFAGAFAAGLFEHIAEPLTVFRQVARVLSPGALFFFTFPPVRCDGAPSFDEEEGLASHDPTAIRGAVATPGLQVIHEVDYPAYRNGSKGWVTHHLVVCRTLPPPTIW
jgi:predicted TPR repeat methyltransferase